MLDFGLAVLARHPRRADLRVRSVEPFARREIKPGEGFGRDDQPVRRRDAVELPDEIRGELAVAVAHEPDVANRAGWFSRKEISRSPSDLDVMLRHLLMIRGRISWPEQFLLILPAEASCIGSSGGIRRERRGPEGT